eukprot:Selendium_serpulae@DN5531_c0_g1_i3.p1
MADGPKKYVRVDGIMKLNPEYVAWKEGKEGKGSPGTTVPAPTQALPVVSSMEDHMALNTASTAAGGAEIPLAVSTNATIEILQEQDNAQQVGLPADDMIDKLGAVLQKYEVPIGLVNKLMMLTEMHVLEFIVDDSGSMLCDTDELDHKRNRPLTRWEEAEKRICEMIEILAYLPAPKVSLIFLNRSNTAKLEHTGQSPADYMKDGEKQVAKAFKDPPTGTTPALDVLKKSMETQKDKCVARYFFGDGVPTGGKDEIAKLVELAKARKNPAGNPLTFMSCTNDDAEVEWMKDLEEAAPYCTEFDDFKGEQAEVLRDQGEAMPYTKGFYLVGQLCASLNPDDLDAMDESVPFTKFTLSNMLGINFGDKEYRHYFDKFLEAQKKRKEKSKGDSVKVKMNWDKHYNEFVEARLAKEIEAVVKFRKDLRAAVVGG